MASIFTRTNEYVQPVKRNTFDLSFQNNLTMQFGKLYPAFVQEVLPGDSFKIKPTFALEFMPMVFPVQTRMRANLHFFYVRNRNLWKDFPDFIANTKEVDPPYLDMNGRYDDFLSVGGLGDYLGIPVTLYGEYGTTSRVVTNLYGSGFSENAGVSSPLHSVASRQALELLVNGANNLSAFMAYFPQDTNQLGLKNALANFSFQVEHSNFDDIASGVIFTMTVSSEVNLTQELVNGFTFCLGIVDSNEGANFEKMVCSVVNGSPAGVKFTANLVDSRQLTFRCELTAEYMATLASGFSGLPLVFYGELLTPVLIPDQSQIGSKVLWSNPGYVDLGDISSGAAGKTKSFLKCHTSFTISGDTYHAIDKNSSPYYDSVKNPDGIKISALVPRGIETIYNAFYRDIRNNPFMIDGQPEYNKYLETQEGGADTTPYKLHYRNWEQDFLTTAVQSPQQGQAPLVGISSNGQLKFQSEDGEVFTAQAKFAEDGETLTGFTVESPNMPAGNLRALVDMASSGISINDLRNVNSLQRWLENNMRKGLRLKDQIKAHFNVDIRYDELDMPEFIGGCSETIDVRMVTQTSADVPDSPLGSYAGQATCVGTSNHNISHYCDEHGYIIGIFSVAPVPNYSQLLPKHFIKRNVLDYFFPEFGHIGYQPIRYNEVCPVQTFNAGDDLNGTFGYQRAWYDYLARTDEVHGLFRTTLRNYLMNRTFNLKPDLSESFLLVDPKQLNDIFATNIVDETTKEVKDDKILGQIYFDVKAKRPIPMFGIPRLE